jgi:hypothetical protein
MSVIRVISVGVAICILSACSDRPSCNDQSTFCVYEHFLFEGRRLPPRHTRTEALLATDRAMQRIPSLVDSTKMTEENALSVSILLRHAYENDSAGYCKMPAYRSLTERFRLRTRELSHHRSVDRNLARMNCKSR